MQHVDLFRRSPVSRLARAGHDRAVLCHDRSGSGNARKAVSDQVNALLQSLARPVRQGRALQITDRVEASSVLRTPLAVEHNGSPEWCLALRTAPRFAGVHASKVDVVGHHQPNGLAARIARGIGFEKLLLDPPSGAVAHAQVSLERERRKVILVLHGQIDRLEVFGQRLPRDVKKVPVYTVVCALRLERQYLRSSCSICKSTFVYSRASASMNAPCTPRASVS